MNIFSEKYFEFLETVKKMSKNTILSYKRDINKYIDFLENTKISIEASTATTVLN